MASSKYKVRLATTADAHRIRILISQDFVKEETIHRSFINRSSSTFAIDMYVHFISAVNPALVAVEIRTGKVVGLVVMQTQSSPNLEDKDNTSINNQRGMDRLNYYYHYDIARSTDLYAHFPETKKHLLLMYLVVQKRHRRKRIAMMMLQQSIEYARNNGLDLVYGIFTTKASKEVAKKVNMTSLYDVDLAAIVDIHGQPEFRNMGEDSIVSVMVIKTK